MLKIIFTTLFLAFAAYAQQKQIAIINTVDDEEPSIKISELNHMTDRLREIATKTLPQKNYAVMTQQSILSLFATPEDMLSKCNELAGCLVKIGREIAADYIAQGRIGRFGKDYTIKVELYESVSGNLVSSFTGNAKDIYGLLAILNEKAPALFANMPGVSNNTTVPISPANSKTSQLLTEMSNEPKLQTKELELKYRSEGTSKDTTSLQVIKDSLIDTRDGKKYKTVKIGNQTWMAENLNYEAKNSKCYDNKQENCTKYGRLYDWSTAMKACPSGWHLPSKDEWQELVDLAGGNLVAGKKLKTKNNWGTDDYGFSALLGGEGSVSLGRLRFDGVDSFGHWMNSNKYDKDENYIYDRNMGRYYESAHWGLSRKTSLQSVRCIQNTSSYEYISFDEEKESKEKYEHDRIKFGIGGVFSIFYAPSEAIFNIKNSEFEYASGMGLKIGLLLDVPIYSTKENQLLFSPELYYSYRGITAEIDKGYSIDSIRQITIVAGIYDHTIAIPLLVKYRFFDVYSIYIPSTYLEGGVQFGFPLKTTMEYDGDSQTYADRNKFDFGIIVGVGAGGPAGASFFCGLRIGYDFVNFSKSVNGSTGIFSDIIMGYYF